MASDTKSKTDPAPKKEVAPKKEAAAKDKSTPDAAPAKAEGGDAPTSYSRGEGQKPVTRAYKENWDAIFGRKEGKRRARKGRRRPRRRRQREKDEKGDQKDS